ncbi:MAG: MFS transporter [Bacteroidetes bacterium]|nr:MFS transporter [Bacteroidota bacterium]
MKAKKRFFSPEAFAAFRSIDFRKFIFSKFMLTLGLQMQFVVLSWQVYEITKDPLSLGFLGLAEAIPAVLFALYGGHVADRFDRRKILIFVIASLVLCSVSLFVLSLQGRLSSAVPFYAIMFLIGVARGFYSPAQFSLMTQLIPRESYANSSAWNSTFWHVAVVIGSSAGGLMMGFLGKPVTCMTVVCLVLISLFQMLRIVPKQFEKITDQENIFDSITTGLKFVFGHPVMLGALTLDLVAVLFGGAVAMLPVFASEVLHVGEKGFGILRAAPFAGAVLMALYLTHHPPLKNAGRRLLICIAGFAVCMILFALSKNFYLSLFILALSGAFDNVSVVIRSTILQLMTPEHMRGRVSSVSTMFISSSNEIGAFESGAAAKLMGLIPSIIFGGGVALVSVVAAAWKLPSLRKVQLK